VTRTRSHDTPGQRLPAGRIDATSQKVSAVAKTREPRSGNPRASGGRCPLAAAERRLIAALNVVLAEKGISHRKAGRLANVDQGDACRVLAFGEATPRTLRNLFEEFHISEYKKLSARDRSRALLLELRATAERQAELLGALAALAAGDDPPGM